MTEVLRLANKTATAFTSVLLLFAAVTLIAAGVGIMNIMLATVHSRIHEIGVRMAIGRDTPLDPVAVSLRGGDDCAPRRSCRYDHRLKHPYLDPALYRISDPCIFSLGVYCAVRLVCCGSDFRHHAGQKRRAP